MDKFTRTIIVVLFVCVLVTITTVCTLNAAYSAGMQAGAKIALNIDGNADGYRAEDVRGDCTELFSKKECIKCHDKEWIEQ